MRTALASVFSVLVLATSISCSATPSSSSATGTSTPGEGGATPTASTTTASSSKFTKKPCDLATDDEVLAVASADAKAKGITAIKGTDPDSGNTLPGNPGIYGCAYDAPGKFVDVLQITVHDGDLAKNFMKLASTGSDAKKLSGVGDEAYARHDGTTIDLMAKGIHVQLNGDNYADAAKLLDLAKKVATRV